MAEKTIVPRVSVLMAVFNDEKHLPQAIESILAQTMPDFEFLIIDDASHDTSPQIIAEYAQRDPRIRVLTNTENMGLAGSLNRASRRRKRQSLRGWTPTIFQMNGGWSIN